MLSEINVSDIYFRTTGSILQQISIIKCRENSQHYMPENPDFKNISMENYKQEIFPTFMLADCVYITRELNRVCWWYPITPALLLVLHVENYKFGLFKDYDQVNFSS